MLLLALLACADSIGDSAAPSPDDTSTDDTGETGAPIVWTDAALSEGGVVDCASPTKRSTEGPFEPLDDPDWQNQYVPPPIEDIPAARGAAVGDFTGDGRPDFLLANVGFDQLFVATEDGSWRDETPNLWHPDAEYSAGATPVDIDDDGDLDLVVANRGGRNQIYLNDGAGAFERAEGALSDVAYGTTGAVAGDLDGDGDLDLLFPSHSVALDTVWAEDGHNGTPGDAGELYLNRGDGTFEDRSDLLPAYASESYTFVAGLIDAELDGDLDPYFVNDFGPDWQPNVLLQNDGWSGDGLDFTDVSLASGAQASICGMGLGVGDVNGDRYPDLLMSSWMDVALLESLGDGTWVDTTLARGMVLDDQRFVGWGTELADMDNDGDLDAPMSFGFLSVVGEREDNPREQADTLWLRDADGNFTEAAEDWGVADRGVGRGFALHDVNDDGFLDMLKLQMGEGAKLYLSRCNERAWLKVSLSQPAPNVDAVGARIELSADADDPSGPVWTDWIHAGGTNLGVGTAPEAHFGLGDLDAVDVVVIWPDGARSRIDDVATRQPIEVDRLAR